MKQAKQLLLFSAIFAGVILLKKKQQATGVGNVFKDISVLQRRGIDLDKDYLQLSEHHQEWLQDYATNVAHYKQGKASKAKYSIGEAFFRSLKTIYKKINAVSGIGESEDADVEIATRYPIYDRNGDMVMVYNDFDDNAIIQELRDQVDFICYAQQNCTDNAIAYWATIFYIAGGGKFVWAGTKGKTIQLTKGLKEEMFPRGNGERKKYISIIAPESKGGTTIDRLTEKWTEGGGDMYATRDGIFEALSTVSSSGEAKEKIRQYSDRVRSERLLMRDEQMYQDVPF